MSGPPQARSSTSTSKSWASSIGSVIGLPATGPARANTGSRLGVSASGDRRPLASRLTPKSRRRKTRLLPALSLQRPALLPKPRRQSRARDDRQRVKVPLPPLRQGAAQDQNQASAHQALHPQDQRQGRALRSDQPAGVGFDGSARPDPDGAAGR
jgi:hypothetical protein